MNFSRVTSTSLAFFLLLPVALAGGCRASESPSAATPTTGAIGEVSSNVTRLDAALSSGDRNFMKKAAQGSVLEVAMGREAAARGTAPVVKSFGSRMVTDYGKARDELKQLAAAKRAAVVFELDDSHQTRIDAIAKLSGAEFDQAYAKDMVDDHLKDVREFRIASEEVNDPDLRDWALKTLTMLDADLSMATDMRAKTK